MRHNDETKTCSACNLSKPVAAFYKQPGNKDGLRNKCKSCRNADHRTLRKEGVKDKEVVPATAPAVSVFSINPETNLPYISFEHAEKLAYTHVMRYAKNLHQHRYMDTDDLKQEVMIKVVKSAYNPLLSSPKTFIINCANSHLGNIAIHKDRKRRTVGEGDNVQEAEVSDYLVYKDNEAAGMMSNSAVDYVTPEDYMMAREAVEEFIAGEEAKPAYKRKTVPTGYKPFKKQD